MPSPFSESIRAEIRLRGYSLQTEKTYLTWIKKFIYFIDKRHSKEVGSDEVKDFLTWLAVNRHVSINTQKVALNALVFLYHKVFQIDLGDLKFALAKRRRSLPAVLTTAEVRKVLAHLEGLHKLAIALMYGSGLRVSECLRLRVQDIDLDRRALTVRNGKGRKDRQTFAAATYNQQQY
jgi:integrase